MTLLGFLDFRICAAQQSEVLPVAIGSRYAVYGNLELRSCHRFQPFPCRGINHCETAKIVPRNMSAGAGLRPSPARGRPSCGLNRQPLRAPTSSRELLPFGKFYSFIFVMVGFIVLNIHSRCVDR